MIERIVRQLSLSMFLGQLWILILFSVGLSTGATAQIIWNQPFAAPLPSTIVEDYAGRGLVFFDLGMYRGDIELRDPETFAFKSKLETYRRPGAFSTPDGTLGVTTESGKLVVLKHGEYLRTFSLSAPISDTNQLMLAGFTNDKTQMYAVTKIGNFSRWNLETGELLVSVLLPGKVKSAVYREDLDRLVAVELDGYLTMLKPSSGDVLWRIKPVGKLALAAEILQNRREVLVNVYGTLGPRRIDLDTGLDLGELTDSSGQSLGAFVKISPTDRYILTSSGAGTYLIDRSTGLKQWVPPSIGTNITFTSDESFAPATVDGELARIALPSLQPQFVFAGFSSSLTSVWTSPDNRFFVTSGSPSYLCDVATGRRLLLLSIYGQSISDCFFTRDSKEMILIARGGRVRRVATSDGRTLAEYSLPVNTSYWPVYGGADPSILAMSDLHSAYFFRARDGQVVRKITYASARPGAIGIAPDGKTVYVVRADLVLDTWNLQTGALVASRGILRTSRIQVSPTGDRLALTHPDCTVIYGADNLDLQLSIPSSRVEFDPTWTVFAENNSRLRLVKNGQLYGWTHAGYNGLVKFNADWSGQFYSDLESLGLIRSNRFLIAGLAVDGLNDKKWNVKADIYESATGKLVQSGVPVWQSLDKVVAIRFAAPEGKYDLHLSGSRLLSRWLRGVSFPGLLATASLELPNGDIDSDGEITILDYSYLSEIAGGGSGADFPDLKPYYADLNQSRSVDSTDAAILAKSFGLRAE